MANGPLDKFLRRAPLEPTQPVGSGSAEDRDQQTAEPPASPDREKQGQQPRGSLRAFLVKLDGAGGSQHLDNDAGQPVGRGRRRARSALDWQLTGQMHAEAAALLRHRHTAAFRQLAELESHSAQSPLLGGAPLPPEEAGATQDVAFDSQGELLVAASEEGLLTVHSAAALAAARQPAGQRGVGGADPLLLLDTHLPKLQAVRWNAADENMVGVVSSATRQLHLYDLQATQGQPAQVLAVPAAAAAAAGLSDLAFFGAGAGGGYSVLAAGLGGQVFLWDGRARATPCATLAAAQGGALYALQLSGDGQVVLAGAQSGEVKLWDLRGGSTSTLRFGGSVHHHPLLASLSVRAALAAVPGLASQTAVPASAVHSMQLDPADPRRLGFHLGCGWSGVLRMQAGGCGGAAAVTHLHAPAHAYPDDAAPGSQEGGGAPSAAQMLLWASTAAPGLRRRACWTPDGGRYCVPSRRHDGLLLLDFADSPAAGCYALREEAQEGSSELPGASSSSGVPAVRAPPVALVPLSRAAVCAAAHPDRDLLVAGGTSSCLSVVGLG